MINIRDRITWKKFRHLVYQYQLIRKLYFDCDASRFSSLLANTTPLLSNYVLNPSFGQDQKLVIRRFYQHAYSNEWLRVFVRFQIVSKIHDCVQQFEAISCWIEHKNCAFLYWSAIWIINTCKSAANVLSFSAPHSLPPVLQRRLWLRWTGSDRTALTPLLASSPTMSALPSVARDQLLDARLVSITVSYCHRHQ